MNINIYIYNHEPPCILKGVNTSNSSDSPGVSAPVEVAGEEAVLEHLVLHRVS